MEGRGEAVKAEILAENKVARLKSARLSPLENPSSRKSQKNTENNYEIPHPGLGPENMKEIPKKYEAIFVFSVFFHIFGVGDFVFFAIIFCIFGLEGAHKICPETAP